MATRTPPALMDELVEEILLRIPPDDPARLVRASVACKRWCRLVCDPGFRRRFRERHQTPPLLGVIRNCDGVARFVPACSFRPRRADRHGWRVMDCRHGRVLLRSESWTSRSAFAVWDPVTDVQRDLPALPRSPSSLCNSDNTIAAVLCAGGGGCNHLDCHSGPYLVVFVAVDDTAGTVASMYSSEADAWGEPTSAQHGDVVVLAEYLRGAHVGSSLYFVVFPLWGRVIARILEYDLVTGEMTLIDSPPMETYDIVPTTLESGGLGCITAKRSALCLWSREAGPIRWVQSKIIKYKIPVGCTLIRLVDVFGFADGGGVIYVMTDDGAFTTDLKSGRFIKVGEVSGRETVVPFMSFYTPALRLGLYM